MAFKTVTRVKNNMGRHWVGDGFPVSSLFSYAQDGAGISPFLLLDYAGPADFEPADVPRGVGLHPHRGFETVTVVYQGEVAHKDNAGNAGVIGPGDVQWMTAARGILHEEMHSPAFTRDGGTLEMVQLWVNLPAKDKMAPPAYQDISAAAIPVVPLPDAAGILRLIAGSYGGQKGAARTFTPLDVWDMRVEKPAAFSLPVAEEHNAMLLVLRGDVVVDGTTLSDGHLAHFSATGGGIALETKGPAVLLLLAGAPIGEPVVGRGPFVMNTDEEIRAAMRDYAAGLF